MIIIPARLESTRFPGKMLCDLSGAPLIVRTAQNAKSADVDDVVIATDSYEILEVVKSYGFDAVLTGEHESGTDRCAEAARILGLRGDELVLNVQGDEPFLESSTIRALKNLVHQSDFAASLARVIESKEEAFNPNLAKVVLNDKQEAIFFSRSIIPYSRDSLGYDDAYTYLCHLGLYGFRMEGIQEYASLPKSSLEDIEKLEQLRMIVNAKSLKIAVVETETFGIDTQEDMRRACALWESVK